VSRPKNQSTGRRPYRQQRKSAAEAKHEEETKSSMSDKSAAARLALERAVQKKNAGWRNLLPMTRTRALAQEDRRATSFPSGKILLCESQACRPGNNLDEGKIGGRLRRNPQDFTRLKKRKPNRDCGKLSTRRTRRAHRRDLAWETSWATKSGRHRKSQRGTMSDRRTREQNIDRAFNKKKSPDLATQKSKGET
jgi:hypothetical protein